VKSSKGELALKAQLESAGIPYVAEYLFAHPRKYRFDFAILEPRIGIEVDGATWAGGRHTTGIGFLRDITKLNLAAEFGYRVVRGTTEMAENGELLAAIMRVLEGCEVSDAE
jgi:very-short-patch-repair endonuclease